VGLEMAENLYKRGLQITVIEKAKHVLASIDKDMAGIVHKYLEKKGVKLRLNTGVKSVENGEIVLENEEVLKADIVLSTIGVKPDVEIAKEAGIKIGNLGGVLVNELMQTSDANIYAVGDMIETTHFVTKEHALIPLAGPANKQARIAADNICGIKSRYNGTQGTSIIKIFDLVVASTGAREEALKAKNISYARSYTHSYSNATYYPGARLMSIKIIWSKETGKLLGSQIVGFQGVDKRIDLFSVAIRAGMTPYDLTKFELAYAPPFSSAKDPVNMAGYVATNIMENLTEVFYWDEIENLQEDKDILIDIRTKGEYKEGTIKNAINMPLDDLRNLVNEIPKDKNIYLFCQIGLRGYVASRILKQNGFRNIKNLSGGYITYINAV
jgi:pyruvate/2-oxoglutarate dehydrogenase complex dihydrolipoamide dehydrogenase (E3) component/rhodanese-related sulfurtransferase